MSVSDAQYSALLQRVDELESDNRFRAHVSVLRKEIEDMTKDFYHEIAAGRVAGTSFEHTFGENSDIDIASGFEVVWNGLL